MLNQFFKRHRRLLSPPAFLILVFGSFGCYTILKHPVTSQEGPEQTPHSQDYFRNNCIDCHADFVEYPYGYFYGVYPEHYFEYPRWGYYYAYPWWWDHYWYDGDGEEEILGGTETGLKSGRRGGLMPPYTRRAPASNTRTFNRGSYQAPNTETTSGKNTGNTGSGPAGREGKKRIQKTDYNSKTDNNQQDDNSDRKKSDGKKAKRGGGVPPR